MSLNSGKHYQYWKSFNLNLLKIKSTQANHNKMRQQINAAFGLNHKKAVRITNGFFYELFFYFASANSKLITMFTSSATTAVASVITFHFKPYANLWMLPTALNPAFVFP